MDQNRKIWNQQQQALRSALHRRDEFPQAISQFLNQHAMVHAADMAGAGLWSFADEVWQGLSEAEARQIQPGDEHSIAWLTWHITRIEDVTMNALLADGSQIMYSQGWYGPLGISARDTGNQMSAKSIAPLSEKINLGALLDYRMAVGQQTRELVQRLTPPNLGQKVEPLRLQQIVKDGSIVAEAGDVLAYWGGLTIAGLLLMPPTRHNFLHLNEAVKLKKS